VMRHGSGFLHRHRIILTGPRLLFCNPSSSMTGHGLGAHPQFHGKSGPYRNNFPRHSFHMRAGKV
jgi:hypothetical protein